MDKELRVLHLDLKKTRGKMPCWVWFEPLRLQSPPPSNTFPPIKPNLLQQPHFLLESTLLAYWDHFLSKPVQGAIGNLLLLGRSEIIFFSGVAIVNLPMLTEATGMQLSELTTKQRHENRRGFGDKRGLSRSTRRMRGSR